MSILEASQLTYAYGQRCVLKELSIRVNSGEIVGLLGPNGAGKTTAFKLLAGLLPSGGATIKVDGHSISGHPIWKRAKSGLIYVPQRPTVLSDFTVSENIEFGLAHLAKDKKANARTNILETFGLSELASARGHTLSGGERRRVELARAFAMSPKVLLADEPFAALDPLAKAGVSKLLRGFCDQGVGVLLTDHDVAQALALCDRIYILFEGKVICTGSPEEVAEDPRVRDTYLGERFAGVET